MQATRLGPAAMWLIAGAIGLVIVALIAFAVSSQSGLFGTSTERRGSAASSPASPDGNGKQQPSDRQVAQARRDAEAQAQANAVVKRRANARAAARAKRRRAASLNTSTAASGGATVPAAGGTRTTSSEQSSGNLASRLNAPPSGGASNPASTNVRTPGRPSAPTQRDAVPTPAPTAAPPPLTAGGDD